MRIVRFFRRHKLVLRRARGQFLAVGKSRGGEGNSSDMFQYLAGFQHKMTFPGHHRGTGLSYEQSLWVECPG